MLSAYEVLSKDTAGHKDVWVVSPNASLHIQVVMCSLKVCIFAGIYVRTDATPYPSNPAAKPIGSMLMMRGFIREKEGSL